MKKEDILQPIVEIVFNKINFIERYKKLSNEYNSRDETFLYSKDEILNIGKIYNIDLTYSKSGGFLLKEQINGFFLSWGFSIRFHSCEFGFSVKKESLNIFSAAPWAYLVTLLSNDDLIKVGNPKFCNYGQIEGLLKEAFDIYQDFKSELLKIAINGYN